MRSTGRTPVSLPANFAAWEELFQRAEVVESSTYGYDPDRAGIGSSALVGDAGNSLLFVPQAPVTAPENRYLFRLCALAVPPLGKAKIVRIRQAATIAQAQRIDGTGGDSWLSVLERQIDSPFWAFSDGNIAWHLRVLRGASLDLYGDALLSPGTSQSIYATDPAMLVTGPGHNEPPAGGVPPGDPVGSLGTFRDLRYPWRGSDGFDGIGYEVRGPAIVVLFASVKQTDPVTRAYVPAASLPADLGALLPEDRFVAAFGDGRFNSVRYRHVGGSIVANVGPLSSPWREIDEACGERRGCGP